MLNFKRIERLKPNSTIIDIIKCYDYKTKNGKVKILGNTNLNLPISYILFYHLHNTQKNQLLLVDLNLKSHWCDDFTL